jgi:tetratricopeptide (TPR) repeat protein
LNAPRAKLTELHATPILDSCLSLIEISQMAGKSVVAMTPKTGPDSAVQRRRSLRLIYVLLTAVVLAGVAISAQRAWHETARREAYLPQLESMARRDPYDGRLLALLGGRRLDAGDYAGAADALAHAIAAGEKGESVWLCLAAAHAALGDNTALGFLQIGEQETDARALYAASERAKEVPAHSPALTLAAAISPHAGEPLAFAYARGSALNGLLSWWGRRHPADSGFATREQWARAEPDNAEAQRWWGLALVENRRYTLAGSVLQRAVALAPKSPDSHLAYAQLLEHAAPPAEASLEYIEALRLRRDYAPALLGLGRMALAENMPISAVRVFKAATRVSPNDPDAWIGLGRAEIGSTRNYDDAQKAFETAKKLAPRRSDFYPEYADVLSQRGNGAAAEALVRQRLIIAPDESYSHYLLGGLLFDFDATPARIAEADSEARRAVRLTPGSVPARLLLAQVLIREKQLVEAIGYLRTVVNEEPANTGFVNLIWPLSML